MSPTIHILHGGFPVCRFTSNVPRDWPAGHTWVPIHDKSKANCEECIAGAGPDQSAERTPEAFMQYFRQNYPGPNTIIHNPDWHAPKIYRAAIAASAYGELLEACTFALEIIERNLPELHDGSMAIKLRAAIQKAEASQ